MKPDARVPQVPVEASVLHTQIGFPAALSTNVLNMVGIGPFVTIPLVVSAMGGPQAMLGWALGAVLALCDGLVWAEFGSAFPSAGGSYTYLREAFGGERWGNLLSFLFLAQVLAAGPLTAASGAVGFAQYASYLNPGMTFWQNRSISMAVCVLATFLLYRNLRDISKISLVLTALLCITMGVIIWVGAAYFHSRIIFNFPSDAFHFSPKFFFGLASATLIAMYDYSGYFNVCLIGGEIANPARNIPRAIVISIVSLGLCYSAMTIAITSVLSWQGVANSQAVVSDFALRVAGPTTAKVFTGLVLVAAFGSVYMVLLGYTRVPFAAALNGHFFRVFARVHPTRDFPYFSVATMGVMSALACLLPLESLIKLLLVIQIATQFIAQCVGLLLMRRRSQAASWPFLMPLFPLPVWIALAGWTALLVSSGFGYLMAATGSVVLGVGIFLLWSHRRRSWPFAMEHKQ